MLVQYILIIAQLNLLKIFPGAGINTADKVFSLHVAQPDFIFSIVNGHLSSIKMIA